MTEQELKRLGYNPAAIAAIMEMIEEVRTAGGRNGGNKK